VLVLHDVTVEEEVPAAWTRHLTLCGQPPGGAFGRPLNDARFRVYVLDPGVAPPREISEPGIFPFLIDLSLDDRWVAVVGPTRATTLYPTAGGPAIPLPELGDLQPTGWSKEGHLRSARRAFRSPRHSDDFRLVSEGKHLDLHVSQEQLDRALRVFQGFLTAFEARGWPVELVGRGLWDERAREYIKPDGKPGATRVRVDGEWINLRLSEKSRIEKTPQTPPRGLRGSMLARWHELHRPSRTQHPSGVLWLVLEAESGRRALKDGGRKTLEEKLTEAPQVLRWMAARARQYRMELEEQRKRWEEDARLREIRERQLAEARAEQERQQAELRAREERFRTLLGRWRLACDTRAYVLEARGLLDAADLVSEQKAELAAQLEWASQYASTRSRVSGDRETRRRGWR
jgi:hypothetical protein